MRILVFGASGQTGCELLRQALERGHTVTAFARQPSKLEAFQDIQIKQGNVSDASAVGAAIGDHDAVVSTLGARDPSKPDPAVVTGVGHIVQAMEQRGLRRLMYLSFIGVPESRSAVGV